MIVRRGVSGTRRTLLLAGLVTGLLLGLVAMHHLSVAPEGPVPAAAMSHAAAPAAHDSPPSPHDGGAYDTGLLHLCLAILTAVAVLVVSTAAWRRQGPLTRARRAAVSRLWTAPRAPPPTAPARLALLCVLRT
ncbi:MAG: DUF6153 family protein [Pseudonocardia sp.]|nr:DUF6153 family protein [Pseudonocardia sp.]